MATVLIVDDDPNTRLLVRTVLTHAGHVVFEAAGAHDALANAVAQHPELILLDLSMPGMNGADFLRTLRTDPRTSATRVALYTASPMNPALRDFIEMYAICAVVAKPSEPAELVAAVNRALSI